MIITILTVVGILVLLILLIAATRPSDFRVARSITIQAAPESVFPHVNELRKWDAWSPWAKLDPNAKSMFEGPAAGVGSSMSWAGNKEVGEGKMTIIESRSNELVRFRLEFLKPFKATNEAGFEFKTEGKQTVVTWTMTGKNNFFFKVFGLFMDCDKMLGRCFEKGLSQLKSVAEGGAKP